MADPLQLAEQRLELPLQPAAGAVAQAEEACLAPVAPLQAVEPRADVARQPRDRGLGERGNREGSLTTLKNSEQEKHKFPVRTRSFGTKRRAKYLPQCWSSGMVDGKK